MGRLACEFCGHPFSDRLTVCPHCARPAAAYPNVVDAGRDEEREALARRVDRARARARQRGTGAELDELERTLEASTAVRTVHTHELERLVSADHMAMATYYRQLQSGLRLPEDDTSGPQWDRLRRVMEAGAFGTYAEDIHFAALSADSRWLTSYGHAALFLREDAIAHRASVFEDNIVLWMREQGRGWEVPPGFRAPWSSRAGVGVAKLVDEVGPGVDAADVVLRSGETTVDDSMIEVHVHGSMTIRSVEHVAVVARRLSPDFREELDGRAAVCGFTWEESR